MNELADLANPFRDSVVQNAWQEPEDVGEIHKDVFDECLRGIASARRGVPQGLLVYGAAGSGKTHLLTRLHRHLTRTAHDAPDRVLHCVFVSVRLQTNPELLWQHVRRQLAVDLMRREQGVSQLQRLIAHQLAELGKKSPRAGVLELRTLSQADRDALSQRFLEVCESLSLPRELTVVLDHLVYDRAVRDASAWLAGESLPEEALSELGLGADLTEDREDSARQMVTALCRLAGRTLPIVFCFDQVEALQRTRDDADAFFRYGQMAADLHDADPHVFLLTCLQSAALTVFTHAVREADYERVAQRHAVLEPLTSKQVEALVVSRLLGSRELAPLRAKHPERPLCPFADSSLAVVGEASPLVPRRVLAAAARLFEELQLGAAKPAPSLGQFLGEEASRRRGQSARQVAPSDMRRVLLHGAEVLSVLQGLEVRAGQGDTDLFLGGKDRTAVCICNEADGRSLAPKLKALLKSVPRSDGARLVVLRDPRLSVSTKAVRSRQMIEALDQKGVRFVYPTVEALAALEALSSLLSDAKAGDLSNDGEPVSAEGVIAWLQELRDLADGDPLEAVTGPVHDLVEEIVAPSSAPQPDRDVLLDLTALVGTEHMVDLEEASRLLGRSPDAVLALARRACDRIAVLNGPPALLFDIAGVFSAAGA